MGPRCGGVAAGDDRCRWHHPADRSQRVWGAEQVWFDPAVIHGTGGGVSTPVRTPLLAGGFEVHPGAPGSRLTPDVAAVSDPFTGVKIVFNQREAAWRRHVAGRPDLAGLAAMMNQYPIAHGGRPLGDINPLLYRVASRVRLSAFHDITLGGNAVDNAGPGFDLATGPRHLGRRQLGAETAHRAGGTSMTTEPAVARHHGVPGVPGGGLAGIVSRAVRCAPESRPRRRPAVVAAVEAMRQRR